MRDSTGSQQVARIILPIAQATTSDRVPGLLGKLEVKRDASGGLLSLREILVDLGEGQIQCTDRQLVVETPIQELAVVAELQRVVWLEIIMRTFRLPRNPSQPGGGADLALLMYQTFLRECGCRDTSGCRDPGCARVATPLIIDELSVGVVTRGMSRLMS